ncbi:hypothetical protein CLV63_11318 [Murinocardiopsis flavida]|uniref:Asp23/Gls24 family envelope stress response protein n=1 Tax=Murinocardiopsis flavida TaxID=645275 RepID=A0A2P8DF58_9ACTN|nr:hypothetical protein [Murinocardiopsis flavida]PSK95855.1 hypothetical protein CLV63_11318 [Murinocardiopsis flavida]
MAVDQPDEPDRLPCGTMLDTLLAHLRADTLNEHEQHCPHCRSAAARHRSLVDAAAAAERDQAGAPPELLDRVMRVVRAEGRSADLIPLNDPGPGATRVRDTTAARILRAACEPVEGIDVGRCRIADTEDGIVVTMTARAVAGTPIPEATREIRRAVLASARDQLGWTIARVDIEIIDVE